MLKAVGRRIRRWIIVSVVGTLLAVTGGSTALGQEPAIPATGEFIFNIFINSTPAGVERIGVDRTADGWRITSTGQIAPPIGLDIRLFEIEYDDQWQPRHLTIDSTRGGRDYSVQTGFEDRTATNQVSSGEDRTTSAGPVNPSAVVLPDFFFGAYEAMAVRLSGSEPGDEIPVYIAPRREVTAVVAGVRSQEIQTAQSLVSALIYSIVFQYENRPLAAEVWVDQTHRLLRVNIPRVGLDVARQDLVMVSTRLSSVRNPGDADVRVPASGFSLAATITTPPERDPPQDGWPAVLLVPGTGRVDRDENLFGVPVFGQLAAGLADVGYLVMRYDKRGIGQSGGRPESAGLDEYADDVRTMVKYLERRDDVDRERIAVVGHGEGGWIGLQAAAKEKAIDALALLAVPGTPGAELVLEQQRANLDRLQAAADERDEQIALQTRIVEALLGEGSWDDVPENMRRRADTIWFRSFLEFEPADVVRRARQPLLILHGELDQQIPPYHADRLAELAQARRRRESTVEVAKLPGINHLLLPATTGAVDEYSQLSGRRVSPVVVSALSDWIGRTLPPGGRGVASP